MTPDNHFSPLSRLAGRSVVADTSSLLVSGIALLDELPKCQLIVPAIVVKELESKRGHATLGYPAREWLRLLESLRIKYSTEVSTGVVVPGHDHITMSVEPNHSTQHTLPGHLQDGSNDSTILAVAFNLAAEGKQVTLMSNDLPMRLHATLDLNMEAIEYSSVHSDSQFDGTIRIEVTQDEYTHSDKILPKQGDSWNKLVKSKIGDVDAANVHVVVEMEGNTKPIDDFMYNRGFLEEMPRGNKVMGIRARATEQEVALNYLNASADELPVVSIAGSAGTGKTVLAIASALEGLKSQKYRRAIVFRSLHEMGQGQEMGFLPGDVGEKMAPWAGAIYDAIDVIAGAESAKPRRRDDTKAIPEVMKAKIANLRKSIELSPITYLRGRSLSDSFIVLDEAQNFSQAELLNILSRAGEGTKMVLCWDADQVDNRFLQSGSRAEIWSLVESMKKEDLFAHVTLKKTERSRLAELAAKMLMR